MSNLTSSVKDKVPTLRDLLPPTARAWSYAILGILNPMYGVAAATMDLPVAVHIVAAGVNGAGFAFARANTQRG